MNASFARLALAAAVFACGAASAQTVAGQPYNRAAADRTSYIPYTTNGYVGAAIGQSKYDLSSGTGNFRFDDTDTAGKIYGGGRFNQNFGLEIGYVNMGRADRAGGRTKAQGIDLAVVGRAPLGDRFDVFGKLGTTYGWTRTSSVAGSGVQGGKDNGFGVLYGVGASYYFTPQLAGVIEVESRDFHFAGTGRDSVRATTVGLRYNY